MKKFATLIFILAIFSNQIYSQSSCANADFSMGNFTNWSGSTGVNDGAGNYTSIQPGIVTGRHTIISAPGTDPNTGGLLSVLPPGASFCAELGNSATNYEAECLSYTINNVNSSNCIFSYKYAVVLQDPTGHTTAEKPKFTIYVKNSSGNIVDPVCGFYEVSASGSIPGFQTYDADGTTDSGDEIRWKDWTTVGMDLSPYMGQNITIEFTTYDCGQGAHFGYAYIACFCGSLQLSQQCLGSSNLLTAPPGFDTYAWSSGGTGQTTTINNPVNGAIVYCTVTSMQGCPLTLQTTLSNQPAIFTVNSPTVCGGQPATITATGTNTYAWSNGDSGSSITVSPTTTTTYTVTATAAGGCTNSDIVTVTVNALPVPDPGPDLTICPGGSATLDASASTGNPPLSYAWNNGINTVSQNVTPAMTTTYTVTVTSNNCSASEPITVNVINNLVVSATPTTSSVCLGGNVPLTASGATNYTWSPSTGLSSTTGSNVTASPTTNTTYTVIGNSGSCSGSASVLVNVNSVSVSASPTNPTICSGGNVAISASGIGLSDYSWSPAAGLSSTTGANVMASPTATTTYTVTGTDAIGCSATASVTVNVITVSAVATSTDENCGQSNGTATVTPAGNCTQTLTYAWNTSPFPQTAATATNLPGGTYTVTVSCGACSATASAVVTNLAGPSVSIITITNATCSYNNGGAVVQASGGTTSTYNYSWSNGQSGPTLSTVYAGTYAVTVTDGVGCTAVNTVNINNTPGPTATITGIDFASCGASDGSANLTVNGGGMPYTFQWNPTGQATQNISGLPTGNYSVLVTDNNGCTASTQLFIGEDPGPTASVLSENEICDQANGTATVSATGGLGVYTYFWSDSNGQTTSTATGLAAGTYTVTVSDGGCSTTQTVNVMETPGPNAGFSANPQVLTIMDGPVSFLDNSSGNVVNWAWTLGDGSLSNGESFDHQYTNIGTYLVTLIITDNNGCQDTTIDTIQVKDIYTLYIPNVFTPNGDDVNDYFFPQGVSVDPDNFDMYIFDRWGNMVFHTSKWLADINRCEGWNGTQDNKGSYNDVVMDVYVYRILTKEVMGPKHEYIGRVALIP